MSAMFQTAAFAATNPPELIAETAVLIDATTGAVLYDKNKDALMEPASTTKMITGLLAIENLPMDRIVTIDAETPFTDGTRIYLEEGEEISVEHLVNALMIESANDTAVALAKEISGSVEDFAVLMNERARELGAKNPSFKNPNGLHLEGHLVSAYDLAMIAKGAMKNQKFREIVLTYKYTIPETNKKVERNIYNRNRLIYDEVTKVSVKGVMRPARYEGATGIKTGSTGQAGGCLVASAKREGTELIAVVLKSTDAGRYGDSIALLDYGFENYFTYKAVDSSQALEDLEVTRGAVNHVAIEIKEDSYMTLPVEASPELVTTEAVTDEIVTAPVEKGQQVGKIEIYEGGSLVGEVPIVAAESVAEGMFLSRFGVEDSVSAVVEKYVLIAAGAIAFFLLLIISLSIRQKLRRKALREKRAREIAEDRARKLRELEKRQWPY